MLSVDDFKPVSLEDKHLFDAHYKKHLPLHSDNLFTTMISWMDYSNYHYAFVDDSLFIMTFVGNKMQFRPPSGKYDRDVFQQMLQLAAKEGDNPPFVLIDVQVKKWLEENYPKMRFKPHRDYFEYVYLSSDLAELQGTKYAKIRNRLNKFKKNYVFSTEFLSEKNMDEVKDFLKRWCLWKNCESDPILENEKKAILYSTSHFFDLNLSGIAIRINDKIEAVSVFEKLNNDTAVVHYEKGSPDYDGIYKAINAETAKILQNDFKFINRQSDMNLPGLRQAKMSYHPHHMVEVYHVDKTDLIF